MKLLFILAFMVLVSFIPGCIIPSQTPPSLSPTPVTSQITSIVTQIPTSPPITTPSPPHGADPSSCWTGSWKTNFKTMRLQQSGSSVSGNYEWDNGSITGTVSGNTLTGTWSETPSYRPPNDAGDFEFTMAEDCNSFAGHWRYDSTGTWNDWGGTRIS